MAVSNDLLKDVPATLPMSLANLRRFIVIMRDCKYPLTRYQPSPSRVWKLTSPRESVWFFSFFECMRLYCIFLGKQTQFSLLVGVVPVFGVMCPRGCFLL